MQFIETPTTLIFKKNRSKIWATLLKQVGTVLFFKHYSNRSKYSICQGLFSVADKCTLGVLAAIYGNSRVYVGLS